MEGQRKNFEIDFPSTEGWIFLSRRGGVSVYTENQRRHPSRGERAGRKKRRLRNSGQIIRATRGYGLTTKKRSSRRDGQQDPPVR